MKNNKTIFISLIGGVVVFLLLVCAGIYWLGGYGQLVASVNGESVYISPKMLNAGSRNGGRHLLDSNIDWGQDVFYLERWCLQHPEVTEIHTALSGSYPIEQTKIPIIKSSSIEKLQPDWYAISVNYLYGKDGSYKQFLYKQPTARIGYSIYVYHVRE